jgi:CubicO group peptidase (beta-lactamase class C family)
MYNRRGRVDGPHYTMPVTKTLTSVVLARAIQCGLLNMGDLDEPVISFMPEIDSPRIRPGVETITLRDALLMKSGFRFPGTSVERQLGNTYQKQAHFQRLFELTAPVTAKSNTDSCSRKLYEGETGAEAKMDYLAMQIESIGKRIDDLR